jgi:putative inorganic carbon (HCO3(-)) transporter
MVGVSLWATYDPRFSLGKVSGVVLGVVLYWAVVRWITTSERLRLGLAIFVVAGAALAIFGLLGTEWRPDKFRVFTPVIRRLPKVVHGLPGAPDGFNPNAVAGCLVLFVPVQIALMVMATNGRSSTASQAGWARTARVGSHAALLLVTGGTVLLLQSRGAWVALLAAMAAFMLWHNRSTRAVALAGLAAAATVAAWIGPARLAGLLGGGPGTGLHSVSGRVEIWSRALYAIRDFPLSGMGMNTFRKVMPLLYPAFSISPAEDVAHAHNQLLQTALDLGLPGLIAYTSIWLLTGSLCVAAYRRGGDGATRTIAAGLGAGLIAHFVFGMTDAIPLGAKPGVLFWFAVALSVALHRIEPSRTARAVLARPFS